VGEEGDETKDTEGEDDWEAEGIHGKLESCSMSVVFCYYHNLSATVYVVHVMTCRMYRSSMLDCACHCLCEGSLIYHLMPVQIWVLWR